MLKYLCVSPKKRRGSFSCLGLRTVANVWPLQNPPEVRVQIVNQPQALELVENQLLTGDCGTILNGRPSRLSLRLLAKHVRPFCSAAQQVMSSPPGNAPTLQANFKNLSLKKIKRRNTRKDDVVTEEKFAVQLPSASSALLFFVVLRCLRLASASELTPAPACRSCALLRAFKWAS